MAIEVRTVTRDQLRAFYESGETAFGGRLRDEDWAVIEPMAEADRSFAAWDGERIVGTAGTFSFALTVPGGSLPAGGVTIVGVHPTHRRRGILRQMMRAQLDHIRERGEPLAILWASEGVIYQRFGYGLATFRLGISVERHRNAFRAEHAPSGQVRIVELDEARRLFPPVHDAVLPTRPGFFGRSPAFWESEFFHDPEHRRNGGGAAWHVVHEGAGGVDGYARYRIRDNWEPAGPANVLLVSEIMAADAAAHLDLWRFLMDVDLVGKVESWNQPIDDPIALTVAEPRALGMTLGDALWLRIVDLPAALEGRAYDADGRLVIEVTDEFIPENAGRWSLESSGGRATVARTSDAADVTCDITDLGAAYLGGVSFARLADALRVRPRDAAALTRADAAFRTPRAPWCPRVF